MTDNLKSMMFWILAAALVALGFFWWPAWVVLTVSFIVYWVDLRWGQFCAWADHRWEELMDAIRARRKNEEPSSIERVVRAEAFVLVDAQGKPRAKLVMAQQDDFIVAGERLSESDRNSPALFLLDDDGCATTFFTLGPQGPVLKLGDVSGNEVLLTVGYGRGDTFVRISDADGFQTFIGKDWPVGHRSGDPRYGFAPAIEGKATSAASVILSKDGKVLWSAP